MFLTDVGKRVYDYAHEIFSLGEELRDSLQQSPRLTTSVSKTWSDGLHSERAYAAKWST